SELKEYDDLPTQIKKYILFLEEYLKLSINFVSLGPDRDQTLIKSGFSKFSTNLI
ncbi:MAG: adenylosuccinate synthase, partial [Cytophagales bacterium]|nr:adenylosuccinate synthase [Cytophagales bacterium]